MVHKEGKTLRSPPSRADSQKKESERIGNEAERTVSNLLVDSRWQLEQNGTCRMSLEEIRADLQMAESKGKN